jgi:hypothetical protein
MALGSWQSLYNTVVLDLMAQQREKELLLLMAINSHCNAFGFCFPGRARLRSIRHCSKKTALDAEQWLVNNGHITVEEIEIPQMGMSRPLYQVSPRTMYVREEFQDYCEAIFDGLRHRDLAWEKKITLILSSTKESGGGESFQHERITTRVFNQNQNQYQNQTQDQTHNQHHNQWATPKQEKRTATTMRNGESGEKTQSEAQPDQRRKAQNRKKEPPGGGSGGDEFEALLSPTVDDDQLVAEIRHVVSTTEYQAQEAVETYTRETLVHLLRIAARRRKKGQLSSPGGWFFTALRKQGERIDPIMPNGQTYQDFENDNHSDDMEV